MKKNTRGEWYWTYEAINGETIAKSSEGYNAKKDCERSVEIMRESSSSQVYSD
jgi:uncharacterized protein YegP (UPF0339 family)